MERIRTATNRATETGSGSDRPHWVCGNCSRKMYQMPDERPRILCPVPTSKGVTMYTCTRCAWTLRGQGDDAMRAQAAFDAHRCEDFPRDEGSG